MFSIVLMRDNESPGSIRSYDMYNGLYETREKAHEAIETLLSKEYETTGTFMNTVRGAKLGKAIALEGLGILVIRKLVVNAPMKGEVELEL